MSFLGVLWFYIKMVGLHLKKWLWMLCLSILNWNLAKEIMDQKVGGFGGAGKLGIKWWRRVVREDWKRHHISKSTRSLKLEEVPGKKLLVMWIMSGMLCSSWIFWYINSLALQGRKEMLASMCDERARMLQDQFNVSMNHVHSLAILVSTFHHGKSSSAIDQKTFAKYTEKTAFERPLISGVAYAQRVLHAEREQFEKEHGWTIKVMDKKQNPVSEDNSFAGLHERSPIQEEYAPVVFAQDTVAHVVSVDMLSGKEDRENILRASASGRGVLTAPFRLLKSRRLGVILTFAVYGKELPSNAMPQERIEATEGYVGGVFDVESLVGKLLQQLVSKLGIYVSIYDTTNSSDPISMYGPHFVDNGPHHISPLHFGDLLRKHEMQCRFKQNLPFPWLAITSSLGFLLIILLIGHVVHAAITHVAKVVRDFHEMMELKARAEAADIAKSQFLATVSHEIRTPMNGVLGMLQMLMDTDLDETQLDYVKTAQVSGKALVSLINEVLDQAKIESGKLELEAVQFHLRSLLDDVLSLFCGRSQDKGIELAAYVSGEVPDILIGDPGRLRQIITNLVDNSIKFTEKGHIFVSVQLLDEVKSLPETTVTEPLSGQFGDCTRTGCSNSYNTLSGFPVVERRCSWEKFKSFNMDTFMNNQSLKAKTSDFINLLMSVEDTGIGMPLEAQARVFTPFVQADSSTSRIHGGTGIGLSIAKCLVDLMNGEIGLASEYHIGSTFTFTAVFRRENAKLNDANDPKHQYEQDYMMPELQKSIAMVVDPRSVRAKVTKYHLHRLGIQSEICSDVSQGLAIISQGEKDINLFVVDEEALAKQDHLFSAFPIDKSWKNDVFNQIKFFLLATSTGPTKIGVQFLKKYPLTVIRKPLRASMLSARLQQVMGVQKKGIFCHRDLPLSSLKSILHGKWILVVDDNAVNLRVATGALKKYGANIECAESGKKAVMVLKPPHKFDACFMDVQMPEMDGFEATRRIRVMEADINDRIQRGELSEVTYGHVTYWHVPILAMTADVIYATHEDCLRSGMDGFVSKPFEESQLYKEVARFFETNSSSD